MQRILLFLPFLILIASCDYIVDLKKTGTTITQEIPWNGANHIEIWAPVKLILTNSASTKMEMTGMDFIVEGYTLTQTDDKLIIEHDHNSQLQENRMASLTLFAPGFKNITANSPCKITSQDTLHIDRLNIVVNGKGAFTSSNLIIKGQSINLAVYGGTNKSMQRLSGKTNTASYHIQGGTDIDALDLSTLETIIVNKSYGDCFVNAANRLQVQTYSTGNVFYTGSPEVEFELIENTLMKATGGISRIE